MWVHYSLLCPFYDQQFENHWCKGSAVSIFRSNLTDYYNIYNYITDIQILVIWLVELTSRDIHYYSHSCSQCFWAVQRRRAAAKQRNACANSIAIKFVHCCRYAALYDLQLKSNTIYSEPVICVIYDAWFRDLNF
jgi:hypothetical protein